MWRHTVRKSLYDLIGSATVQVSDEPLIDYDKVVVYRSHPDGMLWVRRYSEFYDGRFVEEPEPREPTMRMKELQESARLLQFLLLELNHPVPDFLHEVVHDSYTTDTRSEKILYETLEWMTPEFRYALIYSHFEPNFIALASWWERHREIQAIIEREMEAEKRREVLKNQALAKLTTEEQSALGFK